MQSSMTRTQRADAARRERLRRQRIAEELAADHDGVVTRVMLRDAGLTRGQIQVQIERGAWRPAGKHTLSVTGNRPTGSGVWWWALWESGERSALDGASALLAAGLRGWTEESIHVSVPNNARIRRLPGVRHYRLRDVGDLAPSRLRRTKPAVAAIRAAQWARTDRQAATLLAMSVQQRLVSSALLIARWQEVHYSARRKVLDGVIADVCDGAHSLSELDFAALCRQRGLPEPSRQAIRTARGGRVYLDVYWEELGVHVEIQGAHHFQGTAGIDDALRFNELGLKDGRLISIQVPVLGLRTCPDLFLDQIEHALKIAPRRME